MEKLLGSLDDLLVNCADAFEPLGDLYSTFLKLKERVEEIRVTYNEGAASDSIIFCSRQFIRKLKVCICFHFDDSLIDVDILNFHLYLRLLGIGLQILHLSVFSNGIGSQKHAPVFQLHLHSA